MIVLTTLLMAILSAATTLADDNWPQFRGPGGVVEDPTLPETWSATENVKWKTSIPGRGWSSPVVWGDLIFLTSVVSDRDEGPPEAGYYSGGQQDIPGGEHRWMVLAVDLETGELRWSREVHRGHPTQARHLKNSYASETPVADASRIYAYFGNLGIFAFTHEGEPAWDHRLEPLETRYGWGTAASPVLHQGTLFIVNDNEKDSYLLALEATTGKEKWRVSRDEKSNWSTPFVWENELRTELVTTGTNAVRSYDLDGSLLWQLSPMSSITIPTPVSDHGLLYLTSGYFGDEIRPVYAVKPGASGDITLEGGASSSEHVAWSWPQAGPYGTSPLVYDGVYYTLYDRGFLSAHDARTGKEIYDKERIDDVSGPFTASPWAYHGKIFCLSEEGVTYVIRAGADYEVLGTNDLDGLTLATPALVRGSLLIRTASHLYRIATGK